MTRKTKKPKVEPEIGWIVVSNEGRMSQGGSGLIVWKKLADARYDLLGATECHIRRVVIMEYKK